MGVNTKYMRKLLQLAILITLTVPAVAEYMAGDHELFLMPTAYTMPKGASYFSDYEVAIINYTYAVTSRTHVGVFSFFPINKEVLETAAIGIKQNYYSSEQTGCAFWSAIIPKNKVFNLGNVVSFGKKGKSLHIAASAVYVADEDETFDSVENFNNQTWAFTYTIGYRRDLSEKTSLIAEYSYVFASEDDADLLCVGPRFKTKKIAWDIAAARPIINNDDPGLIVLPILKATIVF
ncbi:MAG: hypothetical protein A2539_02300 [Elusimicrobia bacterium RIFOXYD2_FULL_34_15]|nr:MAG: hypothetical protein A2539_02300 [Elusimicrobia bacterium RIFOXYD2_FULL_34_15]